MKCLDIIMFMSILGFLTLNSSICFSENSTLVYEQKSQNHKYSKVTINKSLINKPLYHSSNKNVTIKSIIVRKKDKQVENDISYSFNFIDDNALINDNETTTAIDQALRKSNKDVRYFFPNLTAYQPDGWDSAIVLSNQSNTHTNNDIYVNEPAYIDFAFVNNGYENITDFFYVYLYINDQMIYYDSINGLESGYYVDVEDIEVTFQNAGFYTISMVCDPENFVYEMNENDNIYNAYANILESKVYPDLMPYKRQGWEDIIVVSNCSGTNTNDQLYPGDTAYIDFTIANSGEDDVIQEFQAALLVNGTIIKVMNIDVLEMEYYVSFEDIEYEIPEEGTYNFSIICDYNNVIPEMVEDNNVHQKIIQVEPINVQTDLRTYSFSNWKNFVLSLEKDTQISNTIVSGRKTYIDYIILNDSEEDINNNFIVDLYVNNTKIHSQFVDNLPSQSTLTISDIEYVFPSSGSYSLTVIIDPDNSIRETKEDNNVYTMNIEILPSYSKPNLLPFKPTYWDDIIVVSNLADTNNNDFIFAGETTYLDFFIANMGTVDITDEFFISIYVNQTLLQQYSTQDLSVGQGTSFLDIVYNFKQSGDYTIKIICDIDNNILESNESDNTYQRIIHVADKNLPPSNDNFVDAIAITGISGHITGSNNNSSIEPGEPNHANVFGVQRGNTSVWWKWIAPETAHFSFDTHDSTLNTLLGIYTGEKVDNLKEIASNNHDGSINAASSVIFSCQKGLQYYIAIAGSYNEIGNIDLRWKKIIRPSNDDFSNATIISGTTGYTTGTNVYASKEQYEPKHANRNGGKSIWWKWTSPANGYYYFSSEFKRQYDKETFIAIYKGDSLITLTEIASNFINGSFSIFMDLSDYSVHQVFQSGSAFYAEQGKSFYIAVDGYSGKTGSISLYWEQVTPPLNDNYSQATLISGSSGSITITNKKAISEPLMK